MESQLGGNDCGLDVWVNQGCEEEAGWIEGAIRLWDLLIDLLELLGIVGLRKKRKKKTELTLLKTNDSTPEQDTSKEVTQEGVSVCAGCNRMLEKGAIYELGKAWCSECYKTHVLKVNG